MNKKTQSILAAVLAILMILSLLIALIRKFSIYPEGVTFAILLMNAASPVIDRYTKRRVYGHEVEVKAQ